MWIEIGHFAAIIALLTAVIQCVAPVVGIHNGRTAWIRVGRMAAFAVCLLLTLSCFSLVKSFLANDFSVTYVAHHSSLKLPTFYQVTALWGGHEGSLLFWAWLLALFAATAAWRHWSSHPLSMPWVIAILGGLMVGFLVLILFLSSPFARLFPIPPDGRDLNPLLQDPGMVFHPPFLYLGYVGFAIPYAFAMAALITGQPGQDDRDLSWILATRRWTLFSWAMLTTGIIFGAYWAYYELGWGGYWSWDPVENASFIPWLTGTAFLHSVMVQERRRMFKIWNLFLIIATFSLSLLGTFLVRSGVLSSVHAFATDPGRGVFILAFMSVVLLFSFSLLVFRSDHLQGAGQLETPFCRESCYLFNNLFLIVAAVTVLVGTLYPLAVETLSNAKVSVGAPYYNRVFVPIMLGMLTLMAVGPVIPWRRATVAQLRKFLLIPAVIGLSGLPLALLMGIHNPHGVATLMVILLVAASHLQDMVIHTRQRMSREQIGAVTGWWYLVNRNRRRYGGLLVHFGLLVMCGGFVGSAIFQEERSLVMKVADHTRLGEWELTFASLGKVGRRNWQATEALFQARHHDGTTLEMRPQKRVYNEHSQPTTEAAIHSTWKEDLYVVLGDPVGEGFAIRLYRNPLISWIWWGSGIMALGVAWALMHSAPRPRQRQRQGGEQP